MEIFELVAGALLGLGGGLLARLFGLEVLVDAVRRRLSHAVGNKPQIAEPQIAATCTRTEIDALIDQLGSEQLICLRGFLDGLLSPGRRS